jgi:UDP-N-acetylglucosamine 2-epimerase (non-hydrolysing)
MHVVGARPNFMKIAPMIRHMATTGEFTQLLVHTGQHYDDRMSDIFFEELELPRPDINLEVGSGSHAVQTARIMMRFEPVVKQHKPDWVCVPGDVNSTLACSLVCSKLGIRIAHIEAGLRSFDRSMPEEINRVMTDQLADLLFTPSHDADANLLREGIPAGRIRMVGNIMIDTLVHLMPRAEGRWPTLRQRLGFDGVYALATLHRPSNVDAPATLLEILQGLSELSADIPVIFPVHPRTRGRIAESGIELRTDHKLRLIEPQGYLDFLALQMHASLVLTDSGGVQEETTYLGIPCLTLRANTERPVTLTEGTNRLVRSERGALVSSARAALADGRGRSSARRPMLWDGKTAQRIAEALLEAGNHFMTPISGMRDDQRSPDRGWAGRASER